MSDYQKVELQLFACIILFSFAVGLIFDVLLPCLLLGLSAFVLRHIYYLCRFNTLLKGENDLPDTIPSGLWGEVYTRAYQLQTLSNQRKRRLTRFIRRLRAAATSMPDALVMVDHQREIQWANPAALQLLNIAWPGDRGKSITAVVPYPFLQEYLDRADSSRALEFSPPHDRSLVITVRVTPFGDQQNQCLVLAKDITQQYHLTQTRRDFVTNVSHELKTPLSVISGFIENLMFSEKLPVQDRPLELMQIQAARMQSLIDDLLILSRLEADASEGQREMIKVPVMLAELIDEARIISADKGHVFQQDIDPDLCMSGNKRELYSAFSNLISNAVKHTPQRAVIKIHWGRTEQGLLFSVRDTGEGIAARHIPRLTERFYRVDQSRDRRSGDTGLGLAIVRHVLQRHGGQLHIASEVGLGSTFSCLFPDKATGQATSAGGRA